MLKVVNHVSIEHAFDLIRVDFNDLAKLPIATLKDSQFAAFSVNFIAKVKV